MVPPGAATDPTPRTTGTNNNPRHEEDWARARPGMPIVHHPENTNSRRAHLDVSNVVGSEFVSKDSTMQSPISRGTLRDIPPGFTTRMDIIREAISARICGVIRETTARFQEIERGKESFSRVTSVTPAAGAAVNLSAWRTARSSYTRGYHSRYNQLIESIKRNIMEQYTELCEIFIAMEEDTVADIKGLVVEALRKLNLDQNIIDDKNKELNDLEREFKAEFVNRVTATDEKDKEIFRGEYAIAMLDAVIRARQKVKTVDASTQTEPHLPLCPPLSSFTVHGKITIYTTIVPGIGVKLYAIERSALERYGRNARSRSERSAKTDAHEEGGQRANEDEDKTRETPITPRTATPMTTTATNTEVIPIPTPPNTKRAAPTSPTVKRAAPTSAISRGSRERIDPAAIIDEQEGDGLRQPRRKIRTGSSRSLNRRLISAETQVPPKREGQQSSNGVMFSVGVSLPMKASSSVRGKPRDSNTAKASPQNTVAVTKGNDQVI